jgi:O-antigen/teichoic acid export membrane protein
MSAAFATANVVRLAIAFATSLVIARGLGVDAFGAWTLCLAWAGVLTMFLDFGFGVTLTRAAARGDSAVGTKVGAALVTRFAVLIPAGLAFALAPTRLVADAELAGALKLVPLVAAAGIVHACLAPVFRARLGTLVTVLCVELVGAVAQGVGAWWLLQRGAAVVDLLGVLAAVQLMQGLTVAALWRVMIGSPVSWPRTAALAQALREAWPFAAAGVVANAQERVASVLLGFLAAPSAIASFGAAARIGGVARLLPQSAFAGALPVLSEEAQRGEGSPVRARFDRTLLAFALASAVLLALAAGPIVRLAYGPRFEAAASPLVWMAIGLVPILMNSGRRVYLNASGWEGVALRWSVVALLLQAIACAILIPPYGAAGAAAGLALGEAAVTWPLYKISVQPREPDGRPVGVMGDSPLAG